MTETDKAKLTEMLEKVMRGYGKPLPEQSLLQGWFEFLRPFPIQTIRKALAMHCDESEFSPQPAIIAAKCKLLDTRPTADEAWAIALKSRDESETVIWTEETEQAFYACKPILDERDKIAARVAFKDSYNRLVSDARHQGMPANWKVSLGWDPQKRNDALQAAEVAGLIPQQRSEALMIGYDSNGSEVAPMTKAGQEQLQKILDLIKNGDSSREQRRIARLEAERQAIEARKNEIAEQVQSYTEAA